MSPSSSSMADEMLIQHNYFTWEFNTRMKLMKKGLLDRIEGVKTPDDEIVELWKSRTSKRLQSSRCLSVQIFSQYCEAQVRLLKCGKSIKMKNTPLPAVFIHIVAASQHYFAKFCELEKISQIWALCTAYRFSARLLAGCFCKHFFGNQRDCDIDHCSTLLLLA